MCCQQFALTTASIPLGQFQPNFTGMECFLDGFQQNSLNKFDVSKTWPPRDVAYCGKEKNNNLKPVIRIKNNLAEMITR